MPGLGTRKGIPMSHRERAPDLSGEDETLAENSFIISNTSTNPVSNQASGLMAKQTIVLEVSAAYNRDGLPMPKPNGPNGRRVLNLEMLMNHPLYWEFLNERETEEVLMELYIARTRRMQ